MLIRRALESVPSLMGAAIETKIEMHPKSRGMNMKNFFAMAISCALLFVAYIAAGLDDWLGASCYGSFELAYILIGLIFGAFAYSAGRYRTFLVVPALYLLFVIALPFLDLSPVKPAVRSVREIQPGMSEAQVRAVLDRHFPEHGRFKCPAIGFLNKDTLSFVLDPSDGRYNAAVVSIKFSQGKCVSAEFLAD